jgi:MYXO-CTERM domain-containing protein
LQGSLEGQAIELGVAAPQPLFTSITEEGAPASLPAGPGPEPDPFVVDGVLVCDLATTPTLVLKPTLVMEILGQEYEIADIEVPVTLPPFDETIRFDAIALSFPRPPAPAPDPTGEDSDSDSHGMSGGEDDPTDGADPTEGADPTGSTGASDPNGGATGFNPGPDDDGCSCRSDPAPGSLALLVLLGLGLRRGRRAGDACG